jgi:hypothetical protein
MGYIPSGCRPVVLATHGIKKCTLLLACVCLNIAQICRGYLCLKLKCSIDIISLTEILLVVGLDDWHVYAYVNEVDIDY